MPKHTFQPTVLKKLRQTALIIRLQTKSQLDTLQKSVQ